MSDVPQNSSGRGKGKKKPTGKKSFSLKDFKEKTNTNLVRNKPLKWLELSKAFQEETGLPGFPMGYVSLSRGYTNTGKSTSLSEAVVSAQNNGILPIIIDTENNLSLSRLAKMGFDLGENEEDAFYIYIDNEFLLENFGKKQDKKRKEAAIEDLASCIHHFLDLQEAGELPVDILFAIDSLGTLDCIRTINAQEKDTEANNMWNAGAFEKAFKYLTNNRIPHSRKVTSPYTNTMIAVQKIWLDAMQGAGVVKHKGGEAFAYSSRLIIHHGGIQSHGTKKVAATSKKRDVVYGIESKITIVKNQIEGDLGGISFDGKLISTPHGFIRADNDSKDQYKKDNILFFREILGDTSLNADDIGSKYVDDGTSEFDPDDLTDKLSDLNSDE